MKEEVKFRIDFKGKVLEITGITDPTNGTPVANYAKILESISLIFLDEALNRDTETRRYWYKKTTP